MPTNCKLKPILGNRVTPADLNFGREILLSDNQRPYTPDEEVDQILPEHLGHLEAQDLAKTNLACAATNQAHHHNLPK